MTSVVRAGHLAPYFKATSQVVGNGLKPVVVVATSSDKLVSKPLPQTSTVQALHGALPIQGLKVKCNATREFSAPYLYCNCENFLVIMMENHVT